MQFQGFGGGSEVASSGCATVSAKRTARTSNKRRGKFRTKTYKLAASLNSQLISFGFPCLASVCSSTNVSVDDVLVFIIHCLSYLSNRLIGRLRHDHGRPRFLPCVWLSLLSHKKIPHCVCYPQGRLLALFVGSCRFLVRHTVFVPFDLCSESMLAYAGFFLQE